MSRRFEIPGGNYRQAAKPFGLLHGFENKYEPFTSYILWLQYQCNLELVVLSMLTSSPQKPKNSESALFSTLSDRFWTTTPNTVAITTNIRQKLLQSNSHSPQICAQSGSRNRQRLADRERSCSPARTFFWWAYVNIVWLLVLERWVCSSASSWMYVEKYSTCQV